MANESNNPSTLNESMMGSTSEALGNASTDTDLLLLNLQKSEGALIASEERISQVKKALMEQKYNAEIEHIKKTYATEEEQAKALKELQVTMDEDIVRCAQIAEANFYKFSSKQAKIQALQKRTDTLNNTKFAIKQRRAEIEASNASDAEKRKSQEELTAQALEASKKQLELEGDKRKLIVASLQEQKKYGALKKDAVFKQLDEIAESYRAEVDIHQKNIDDLNEEITRLEDQRESATSDEERDAIDQQISNLKGKRDDESEDLKKADKERFGNELLVNTMKAGFKSMSNAIDVLGKQFISGVDNAINAVGQYKSFIDARLQGTQSSYNDVTRTLKRTLAMSPIAKQTEVLEKLKTAIDQGIAYNAEQRAFLATMTDKIVSTFDAFDANLMRIIRLQQADTTAARMGMEANLLQFFNSTFSDNSYLKEGYDTVSHSLVDANAQMTRDMSISFEFNVQKWLGSLASLGFGTDTIQKIATGINYLGSGNVQALAGDTQLQSLLAMSASRAGLSYSDLLVQGIDDSSVNKLLKSMVEYLAEIAKDDNAVVKAAYGDVFNFSQADLRAIKNLNTSDIANIANQTMTYTKAMNETQLQLLKVYSRLSMTEMLDNVFDNFLYTAGESIASDPISALMWRTLSTIEEVTGGIEIPEIDIMGYGIDLNMSIESLLKTGMFGLSALGNVGKMASSLLTGGGIALDAWGGTEYTKRGGNFTSTIGGVQSSISGSKAVVSASSSDTKKQAMSSTEEDQESQSKSSRESMKDDITIETLYKELFEKKTAVYVIDNPVKNKVTDAVAAINDTKSRVSEIHKLLTNKDNPIVVSVANLDTIHIPKVPEEFVIKDVKETPINKLAAKISDGVIGKAGREGDTDGVYTISDLVYLLSNGTISVSDSLTREQLTEMNRNFL